jgi:hypothetical protein
VRRLDERRQTADVRARHGCPCVAERVSESARASKKPVACRAYHNFDARER